VNAVAIFRQIYQRYTESVADYSDLVCENREIE
jgi:hypothetical protein